MLSFRPLFVMWLLAVLQNCGVVYSCIAPIKSNRCNLKATSFNKEKPMKKTLALIACALTIALASTASFAASKADALTAMKTAREKLVALIDTKEPGTQKALIDEIHKASDDADAQLAGLGDDAKAKEAKGVWEEFKKTRETEIIPAVQKGDVAKAKEIASGVQKDRFKKLLELLQ